MRKFVAVDNIQELKGLEIIKLYSFQELPEKVKERLINNYIEEYPFYDSDIIDLILELVDRDLRGLSRKIYKTIDQYEEEISIPNVTEALEEDGEIYTISGKWINVEVEQ